MLKKKHNNKLFGNNFQTVIVQKQIPLLFVAQQRL